MCGITGIWGQPDRQALEAMTRALAHRGPDGQGIWINDKVGLGHRRLSIIDLSEAASQPMLSPDGKVVLVYNGEMYNYKEERARLEAQGVTFRTQSDTEVLLALYMREGEEAFARLRGMFAFAIYDRRETEKLVLARDAFGIKPLLYAHTPQGMVFGSELKALLKHPAVDRAVDPQALEMLLVCGSIYQPDTIFTQVKALEPGHVMVCTAESVRITPYWEFGVGRRSDVMTMPKQERRQFIASVLEDSVARQMVADVPVGAFLSGGVDSALLVALMAKRHKGKVETFSVGYEGDVDVHDESDDAEAVARWLGTRHHRVTVNGKDAAAAMPHFIAGLDQPSVDGANAYFVSKAAATSLKVAISGTGGDELFAGYPWFQAMQQYGGLTSAHRWKALVRGEGFLEYYGRQYRIFAPKQARSLVAVPTGFSQKQVLKGTDILPHATPLQRTAGLTLSGYMRQQLLRDIDGVSMAHGLEIRVPFLDPVLADAAFSLPAEDMMGMPDPTAPAGSYAATGIKAVLLEIAAPLLPPEFNRRAKRGFTLPFGHWMRQEVREMVADTLSEASVHRRGWWKAEEVTAIREAFYQGKCHWTRPWLLMVTELWARQMLDARG